MLDQLLLLIQNPPVKKHVRLLLVNVRLDALETLNRLLERVVIIFFRKHVVR